MEWYKQLNEICIAHDLEAISSPDGILEIRGAELPSFDVQKQIRGIVPDRVVTFSVGPKITTLTKVGMTLRKAGALYRMSSDVSGILYIDSTLKDQDLIWDTVEGITRTDKFIIQVKKTYIDPKTLAPSASDLLEALKRGMETLDKIEDEYHGAEHPQRERTVGNCQTIPKSVRESQENQDKGHDITKDDLTNLRIDLGQAQDANDFINSL